MGKVKITANTRKMCSYDVLDSYRKFSIPDSYFHDYTVPINGNNV